MPNISWKSRKIFCKWINDFDGFGGDFFVRIRLSCPFFKDTAVGPEQVSEALVGFYLNETCFE